MAVNEIKNPSSLRIKLDLGMVDGKTKVKSKTFSSVKPDASAQNVYEVAEDITESEIKSAMDLVVDKNIFAPNGADIASIVEAKVVVTDTTPYDLEL